MAHFYGTLVGNRGIATRQGTKNSDLTTVCASWEGAIQAQVHYDSKKDCDIVRVMFVPWYGKGISKEIYHGPISGDSYESGNSTPSNNIA